MSFYVEKSLATGRFRFAARRRRELTSIDDDPTLSTGAAGEFVRQRPEIFYSADHRPIRQPDLPPPPSIATTAFSATLIDGTPRGWAYLGLLIVGALFLLIGLSVLLTKGPAGWVEIILGVICIAIPLVMTAQRRATIRAAEQKRRTERAEQDAREREMVAAYAAALDRVRDDPSDANLLTLRREREKLDLPYAIWGDAARSTIQQVGFRELARLGVEGAPEIAALMDRASSAAGLIAEDAIGARDSIYSTVLWHLLADDRLGKAQLNVVRTLQSGLHISEMDVPIDTLAESQFERLRGIDHRSVPKCEGSFALAPREFCIFRTQYDESAGRSQEVAITNKRLVLGSAKKDEIAIGAIDQIDVDADLATVTISASGRKRPLTLRIAEPIYFASMLSLATTLDERPKSFT